MEGKERERKGRKRKERRGKEMKGKEGRKGKERKKKKEERRERKEERREGNAPFISFPLFLSFFPLPFDKVVQLAFLFGGGRVAFVRGWSWKLHIEPRSNIFFVRLAWWLGLV